VWGTYKGIKFERSSFLEDPVSLHSLRHDVTWPLLTDYSTSSAWSSCGFLHNVLVKFTDVSEERIASIFRVSKLVQVEGEEMQRKKSAGYVERWRTLGQL